jgi:DNA polymerase IIIc chi subunit
MPRSRDIMEYLVVVIDYSTKWVEAEPLAKITAKNVLRFFKRNILARFGVPALVISDNGTQFTDQHFQDYLRNIGIKQSFISIEHPQANDLVEAANRVILRGIRSGLDTANTQWAEELHAVLWAYRTTPHSTTGKSPFRLTYGTEAVLPIELTELTWRTNANTNFLANTTNLREELEFVDEVRIGATLRESALKQKIAARHSKKVIKREFNVGDLVFR